MHAELIWLVTALLLFAAGSVGLAVAHSPIRALVALNIVAGSVTIALLAASGAGGAGDPRAARAMGVLGILVAFGVTTFGAVLVRRRRGPPEGTAEAPDDEAAG
ncbi:hypothetical protein ER308_18785 [Egibacter rhizosphaerae]|uniref:NADH-quinone oxidoreductase subunit K n=1 Tax=Egibacter rhizosphaerae TaxID=1670831 RepID=A0A411YJI6_9ACTN|nr:hypothetical protein [Egibacter rhizosphaerae]QBI21410.1 hypothetical protein ER308_18785 [Egibacter rhizosphaerae]